VCACACVVGNTGMSWFVHMVIRFFGYFLTAECSAKSFRPDPNQRVVRRAMTTTGRNEPSMSRNRRGRCSYVVSIMILVSTTTTLLLPPHGSNVHVLCEAFVVKNHSPSPPQDHHHRRRRRHRQEQRGQTPWIASYTRRSLLRVHPGKNSGQNDETTARESTTTTTKRPKSQRDGSVVGIATVVLGYIWLQQEQQSPLVEERESTVVTPGSVSGSRHRETGNSNGTIRQSQQQQQTPRIGSSTV